MTCTRRAHSYWTTCACPPCAQDRRRKAKLARTIGIARVPSEAAWDTIDRLIARGWSGWAIASAAGLPRRSIEGALTRLNTEGRRVTFGPMAAAAIVNHGEPTAGMVGVTPSRRRLQGLARQGWDLDRLAAMCDLGPSTLAMIRSSQTRTIRATAAAEIARLTTQVGMRVGDSEQARRNAERKGWASLLDWDDIDTDPRPVGYEPAPDSIDPAVVARCLAGDFVPATRAERVAVAEAWVASGRTQNQLERASGWNVTRDKRLEAQRVEVAA